MTNSSDVAKMVHCLKKNPAVLAKQFALIDQLLFAHRQYWQFRPFDGPSKHWPSGLLQCLDGLSLEQVWQFDSDEAQLAQLFQPWLPVGKDLLALCAPFSQSLTPSVALSERAGVGVPGRKWQQIKAFIGAMPKPNGKLVEWCAGKGHLGRSAAVLHGCEVVSLEWDQILCREGAKLALKHDVKQSFVCTDVMASGTNVHISSDSTCIALHACGDLHVQLMHMWLKQKGAQLMLAPCCYHLTQDSHYQPLSRAAKVASTQLVKADLSLALQSTVTGGLRVERLRDQEANWRLSFDLLQRQIRGIDEYLPLQNIQKRRLAGSFKGFLMWAADSKGLTLPQPMDEALWLARGQDRLLEVRRTELVGKLFRRALELWLVLDRALFLQEQGATVTLSNFCDYQQTPRNFLIVANRDLAHAL